MYQTKWLSQIHIKEPTQGKELLNSTSFIKSTKNLRLIKAIKLSLDRVKKMVLSFREPNLMFLMVPKIFSHGMFKVCNKLPLIL